MLWQFYNAKLANIQGKILDEAKVSRNVANLKDVNTWVAAYRDSVPAHAGPAGAEIRKWFDTVFRNYLISGDHKFARKWSDAHQDDQAKWEQEQEWLRKKEDKSDVTWIDNLEFAAEEGLESQVQHIVDYFIANPDLRYQRISFEDAVKNSDKWLKDMLKGKVSEGSEGEEVKKKYSGYSWVRLTKTVACEKEGKLMGHCVGSYGARVENDDVRIYSLRDSKNEPHVTVEASKDGHTIRQIKGKQNVLPTRKYKEYVYDFLMNPPDDMKIHRVQENISKMGLVVVSQNDYYSKDDLKIVDIATQPDGSAFENMSLSYDGSYKLPKNLTLRSISVSAQTTDDLIDLPDGLKVLDGINVYNCRVRLGDNTKVMNNDESNSKIAYIGKNCYFKNSVQFSTALEEIGDGFECGGSLRISNSPIRETPKKYKIKGELELKYCERLTEIYEPIGEIRSIEIVMCRALRKLPKKLDIRRNFILRSCDAVENLPAEISCDGDIIISSDISVDMPKKIKGKSRISITITEFKSMAEKISTNGSLIMRGLVRRAIKLPKEIKSVGVTDISFSNDRTYQADFLARVK